MKPIKDRPILNYLKVKWERCKKILIVFCIALGAWTFIYFIAASFSYTVLKPKKSEFDIANDNMKRCDSLFYVAEKNGNNELMNIYNDSTMFYTGQMIEHYSD